MKKLFLIATTLGFGFAACQTPKVIAPILDAAAINLPANTPIHVVATAAPLIKEVQEGNRIRVMTLEDVVINGKVVIPKLSDGYAKILKVSQRTNRTADVVMIVLESVVAADGQTVQLQSDVVPLYVNLRDREALLYQKNMRLFGTVAQQCTVYKH